MMCPTLRGSRVEGGAERLDGDFATLASWRQRLRLGPFSHFVVVRLDDGLDVDALVLGDKRSEFLATVGDGFAVVDELMTQVVESGVALGALSAVGLEVELGLGDELAPALVNEGPIRGARHNVRAMERQTAHRRWWHGLLFLGKAIRLLIR